MRTLIISTILSLISQISFAQKNFEGILTYVSFSSLGNERDTQTVYFGKKKIRINNHVYDFKTGFVYTFSPGDSDYIQEPITDFVKKSNRQFFSANKKKKISSFNCSAYEEKHDGQNNLWKNLQTLRWYIDSLNYFIPQKFKDCTPISENYIDDGKIIAGIEVISIIDSTVVYVSEARIMKQQIPDSIFKLPLSFAMKLRNIPYSHSKKRKPLKNRILIGESGQIEKKEH